MSCLIIGNHTQGLGILRSLAETGDTLHLVNDKSISLSRFSKYLKKYHMLPRGTLKEIYIKENSEDLFELICRIIPKGAGWPAFCINEDLVYFLNKYEEAFEGRLVIPDNPFMDIIDKYRFAKEMEKIGLSSPKAFLLSSFDCKLLLKGQYVCKGRIGNRFRNLTSLKGKLVKDRNDLERIEQSLGRNILKDDVLVQEKLRENSKVYSCCGLAVEGKLYRHFQYVKLRQHPDQFGTGTFLKSIWNQDILGFTMKIIGHFSYTGIFEIEYLIDNDGYCVLEMNPRTWKSIHFATLCGQNMCLEYYKYLLHRKIPFENMDYSIGKTWTDLGTDIPMLLKTGAWRNPRYSRNTFFCVANRKDPLPFIMEIILAPLIKMDF